ncbi:MAG: dihydroorotase [Terracidiphilus sp.]|nr:dihydroorotase [Terracidiphilus sp.]
MSLTELSIRRPDDWHLHLRDGEMLRAVLPYTAAKFARAIVMPNLDPPVVSAHDAVLYRQRIVDALPHGSRFEPLMTCYLTDETRPESLADGYSDGIFAAAKLYPAHATTNSRHGVRNLASLRRVFETMQRIGMPLLIHGESTDPAIDIFDREKVFVERTFLPLLADFPALKIVLEHITTACAADLVRATAGARLAATITPHHLWINRNAMFAGGLRPHAYCLPVAKREADRQALRRAATSGEPCFFLGTDSAPHRHEAKESACGCAGIFCAPTAIETCAQVFEEENALDRLEAFTSTNGAHFYGLPLNEERITLHRQPRRTEEFVETGSIRVVLFRGGEELPWRLGEEAAVQRASQRKSAAKLIARSAAMPWKHERPPHLPCRRGELPQAVLFPGDPGRLDRFAHLLEDFRTVGQNREFRIGVGKFNGVELGVCSTGIGGPSTEIALVEAAELGCRFALRVGGTGALVPSIELGSLLLVTEALRGGGAASFYAPPGQPAQAHPQMIAALEQAAGELGLAATRALIASTDSYYAGQGRAFPHADPRRARQLLAAYQARGAMALDMEGESILAIGGRLQMVSGVLLAVHGNRSTDKWLEAFGDAQDRMIRLGCQALAILSRAAAGNSPHKEQPMQHRVK